MILEIFTKSTSIVPTQYLRREARLEDTGPSHRTSPQNSTTSKSKTLLNPSYQQLPLTYYVLLFALCDFGNFHKVHFHSTQSVHEEGSKVDGHWTIPYNTIPKLDPLRIECPFKFTLHLCSSYFPFNTFRTFHFSHFTLPTLYFLSAPRILVGSKVEGHWTTPYKSTFGRPLQNPKPF